MTLDKTDVTQTHEHTLSEDLSRCIHCGFCLQACPTYLDLGLEADSPRGRIQIIAAIEDGRAQPTPNLLGHLDLCLQCRACETACPSGVPFGRIMETARAQIAEGPDPPLTWRLRIAAMRQLLPHAARLRAATAALRLYQRSPVRDLVRRSGVLRHLPGELASAEASLPEMPHRQFSPPRQPAGLTRSVAMLTGCVMPLMYPRSHDATVRVLNRLGYRVVFPGQQTCCGALSLHGGDRVFARDLARRNIDAFLAPRRDGGVQPASSKVTAVIVNSAGCGSTMKEYADLLSHDAAYRERAQRFVDLTKDILEFVADHNLGPLGPLPEQHRAVTYQDSCHLVHAQKVTKAPRVIMKQIPNLVLREMSAPDRCCGSAGIYSFVQREMSGRLLQSKMDDVAETGATCVATANPGCMTQLEAGLRLRNISGDVVHVIELLDESMRAAERAGLR